MSELTHVTIGMHRYPVHVRTFRKNGRAYQSFRVRLTKDIDPLTGRRAEEDVTAPTLERLAFKLRERLHPYDHLLNPHYEQMEFRDLVEAWYQAGCTTWEESTQRSYRRMIDFYHIPLTKGRRVPEVLISGHHANIKKWQDEQSLEVTRLKRPDLL